LFLEQRFDLGIMITSSPLFAFGIKVLGLTAIAAILFSANLAIGIQNSYAQFQQQQQQQRGDQQVESDGGLIATLNGDSFRRGDTITVSGTVGEREIDSYAVIEVIDPESQTVVSAYPDITADNTFTHSFTAGEAQGILDVPMTVSGNYRMTVSYTVPGEGFEREEVEFIFKYDAEATTVSSSSGISRGGGGGATAPLTTFESSEDGFRIGVPSGWVVDDEDNTSPSAHASERTTGIGILATLCPQADALPAIGGNYTCTSSAEQSKFITVLRLAELQTRPEFADVVQQNRTITTSDLFALIIQFTEDTLGAQNFRVVNDTDTTVDVIDSRTNQTVGTAPAKYVDFTYNYQDELGMNINGFEFQLIVLSNDSNTGYVVVPSLPLTTGELQLSPEMIQVLDSFALVTPITSIATTLLPLTTAPEPQQERQQVPSSPLTQQLQLPSQQQQLQQQQENLGTSVSIVPGSSSLTTGAYQPNPFQVSIGAPATWVNDDAQPHTVTSGENATPDGRFDSGIMAPAADFEHTFTEAGEYPYFCLLHPTMVGTVSVS
jgi:plastocyanin